MADIREQDLALKTTLADTDWIRLVTPTGNHRMTVGQFKDLIGYTQAKSDITQLQTDVDELIDGINGVVQSGSNSDGYWYKFDNGLMICHHTLSVTYDPQASGGLYRSTQQIWTYPQEFVSPPAFSGHVLTVFTYTWLGLGANVMSSTRATFVLWGPSAYASTGNVAVTAIGRWK